MQGNVAGDVGEVKKVSPFSIDRKRRCGREFHPAKMVLQLLKAQLPGVGADAIGLSIWFTLPVIDCTLQVATA